MTGTFESNLPILLNTCHKNADSNFDIVREEGYPDYVKHLQIIIIWKRLQVKQRTHTLWVSHESVEICLCDNSWVNSTATP